MQNLISATNDLPMVNWTKVIENQVSLWRRLFGVKVLAFEPPADIFKEGFFVSARLLFTCQQDIKSVKQYWKKVNDRSTYIVLYFIYPLL